MKRLIAVAALALLATPALADPQSEISAYRKSYGLSAVTVDPKLTELARKQANAMAERRSMDHDVYASFPSRMASYGAASAAENIAAGTKTFEDTLAIWKFSPGHNANLLKSNVTRIGLASASSHGTTYWALILAAPTEPKQRSAKQDSETQGGTKQGSAKQGSTKQGGAKQGGATQSGGGLLSFFPFVTWMKRGTP
jgi:hypothetical protein